MIGYRIYCVDGCCAEDIFPACQIQSILDEMWERLDIRGVVGPWHFERGVEPVCLN